MSFIALLTLNKESSGICIPAAALYNNLKTKIMELSKKTKKELVEIIMSKDGVIHSMAVENSKLEEKIDLMYTSKFNLENKLKELKRYAILKELDSISEIKSVQNMLLIYTTGAMTHREKSYLGEKINTVIDEMVEKKNVTLLGAKMEYRESDSLPF